MYAKNIVTFLLHLQKEEALTGESDDEIVRDTLITRGGKIVNVRVQEALGSGSPVGEDVSSRSTEKTEETAAEDAETESAATETTGPESTEDASNPADSEAELN